MNRQPGGDFLRFCIVMISLLLTSQFLAADSTGRYRPGEVICKMEEGYDIEIIINDYGMTENGYQAGINCHLLGIQSGQDAESLAAVIETRAEVQYCRANYYLDAPEPFQRSQPFLDYNFAGNFDSQAAAITLNLFETSLITTGENVKVAVIDGGINLAHPEFAVKSGGVYSGWDYVDGDPIANDEPGGAGSGHGTFVAGVIKLTAPSSEIYAYRVLDTLGTGDGYTIAEAVLQAVADSCRVINLSLGMADRHEALDDAIKVAEKNHVIVVAAAGNDSTSNDYIFPFPASKTSCLAVAAVDSSSLKADFSNYGQKVDLCAPGMQVYAPYLDSLYGWWDGTSFAAPFVSGLAALMISVDPLLTNEELDSILAQSSMNIDSLNPGLEGMLGHGLIDPLTALSNVRMKICGDADGSGEVNISDAVRIINYIFTGGPAPEPLLAGDVDCSGSVNITDAVCVINYIFLGMSSLCEDCK